MSGDATTSGNADTSVSFLGMLGQALMIVQQSYPSAQFYEADLNIEMAGSPWRFVFNDPSTSPNSTVILKNYMGQFQLPPQHISQPWLEDRVIPMPVTLDLAKAQAIAQQKYSGNITQISLRWPLYPGVNEPNYIFTMPTQGGWVFVGVYTQRVSFEPFQAEAVAAG
ncbi:MAG TPA: hypothetical protein VJ885_17030 [Thermoanaerobaculia bacterium]|nr:hypothetical protein [Thermoanaerobaculia bacterium]